MFFDKSDLDYFSTKADDFQQAFLSKDPLKTAELYRDVLAPGSRIIEAFHLQGIFT
jgi:hypothetical protein